MIGNVFFLDGWKSDGRMVPGYYCLLLMAHIHVLIVSSWAWEWEPHHAHVMLQWMQHIVSCRRLHHRELHWPRQRIRVSFTCRRRGVTFRRNLLRRSNTVMRGVHPKDHLQDNHSPTQWRAELCVMTAPLHKIFKSFRNRCQQQQSADSQILKFQLHYS